MFHSKENDKKEILLKDDENKSRYVLFPIKYPDIFQAYKKAVSAFWVADEINFEQDLKDLEKLKDDEKSFIKQVLAFFAASDGIVIENLGARFLEDIAIPEAKQFYSFQISNEAIHSETYSLLIDTYCKSEPEKLKLLNAINTYPAIKEKAEWAIKWIKNKDASFAQRLIAFAIVEGVFFSASFCAIFWLRERGMLPGLSFANQLISRDESMHTEFACLLYSKIKNRVPMNIMEIMMKEAVDIEERFITESIQCQMIGMNADLMKDYIKFIADRVLQMLGYKKIYYKENPFQFMELSSFEGKTNFFDTKVAEYSHAGVSFVEGKSSIPDEIVVSDDF
jgi:ribonucleotide reductase beta subunit family protein with ferritin-like domain